MKHLDDSGFARAAGRSLRPGEGRHLAACSQCREALAGILAAAEELRAARRAVEEVVGRAVDAGPALVAEERLGEAARERLRAGRSAWLAERTLRALGPRGDRKMARAIARDASEGGEALPLAAAPLDLTRTRRAAGRRRITGTTKTVTKKGKATR